MKDNELRVLIPFLVSVSTMIIAIEGAFHIVAALIAIIMVWFRTYAKSIFAAITVFSIFSADVFCSHAYCSYHFNYIENASGYSLCTDACDIAKFFPIAFIYMLVHDSIAKSHPQGRIAILMSYTGWFFWIAGAITILFAKLPILVKLAALLVIIESIRNIVKIAKTNKVRPSLGAEEVIYNSFVLKQGDNIQDVDMNQLRSRKLYFALFINGTGFILFGLCFILLAKTVSTGY